MLHLPIYRNSRVNSANNYLSEDSIHEDEKMFDTLVQPDIFSAFDQERIILLVIPAKDDSFGPTDWP